MSRTLPIIIIFFIVCLHLIANSRLTTAIKLISNDSTYVILYQYSANNQVVLETKSYKQDSYWTNFSQTAYTFDNDVCTQQIERRWNNGAWYDVFSINYHYNNGKIDQEIHSKIENGIVTNQRKINYDLADDKNVRNEYDSTNDNWVLKTQTITFFNNFGKPDSIDIKQFENGYTTANYSYKNYYDGNRNLYKQYIKFRPSELEDYMNLYQLNWYYNEDPNLIEYQYYKIWNKEYKLWENFQKIEYVYNPIHQLQDEIYQYWDNNFWVNDLKYNYLYNVDGLLTKKDTYRVIYNSWRPTQTVEYSDITDNKANTIESKFNFWGGIPGSLNITDLVYQFNTATTTQKAGIVKLFYDDTYLKEEDIDNQPINVYPNPSNGIYYISSHEKKIQEWQIIDFSGRVCKTNSSDFSKVNIQNLPNGLYLIKIATDKGNYSQKLIKK